VMVYEIRALRAVFDAADQIRADGPVSAISADSSTVAS